MARMSWAKVIKKPPPRPGMVAWQQTNEPGHFQKGGLHGGWSLTMPPTVPRAKVVKQHPRLSMVGVHFDIQNPVAVHRFLS